MIGIDADAAGLGDALEGSFRDESVGGAKRDLVERLDVSACMIAKDGPAAILETETLLSAAVGKSTANGGLVLVDGDANAWYEVLGFE